MKSGEPFGCRIRDSDLELLFREAPDARTPAALRRMLEEDPASRRRILGREALFRRVASDDDLLMRLSPALYFEILLRRAQQELEGASHTYERTSTSRIPVFDARGVTELLARPGVVEYLAHMLESLMRVESRSYRVRGRRGAWRRIRFNDTDIDCLLRFCENADEEDRLRYYKRIADVCLFILGIFPQHVPIEIAPQPAAMVDAPFPFRARRGFFEYEAEARRYYKLAGDHPAARELAVADVFQLLHENLAEAKKPLNYIAENYLRFPPGSLTAPDA